MKRRINVRKYSKRKKERSHYDKMLRRICIMTKNLGEMTVKELKEVAKSAGIKGYSSMTKAELISSIEEMNGRGKPER